MYISVCVWLVPLCCVELQLRSLTVLLPTVVLGVLSLVSSVATVVVIYRLRRASKPKRATTAAPQYSNHYALQGNSHSRVAGQKDSQQATHHPVAGRSDIYQEVTDDPLEQDTSQLRTPVPSSPCSSFGRPDVALSSPASSSFHLSPSLSPLASKRTTLQPATRAASPLQPIAPIPNGGSLWSNLSR